MAKKRSKAAREFGQMITDLVKSSKVNSSRTRDQVIEEMLSHFHPDSQYYGGWPIYVDTLEETLIVNEEFKGILKAKEVNILGENKFLVRAISGLKFKDKHTVMVLRPKAEIYERESERLYVGIKKLIGE